MFSLNIVIWFSSNYLIISIFHLWKLCQCWGNNSVFLSIWEIKNWIIERIVANTMTHCPLAAEPLYRINTNLQAFISRHNGGKNHFAFIEEKLSLFSMNCNFQPELIFCHTMSATDFNSGMMTEWHRQMRNSLIRIAKNSVIIITTLQ